MKEEMNFKRIFIHKFPYTICEISVCLVNLKRGEERWGKDQSEAFDFTNQTVVMVTRRGFSLANIGLSTLYRQL